MRALGFGSAWRSFGWTCRAGAVLSLTFATAAFCVLPAFWGHTTQAAALHLTVTLMREIPTGWIDLIDLIINLNLVLGYFS